jgi:RsmE family RNA methyltransferase
MLFFVTDIYKPVEGIYTNHFFSMRVRKGDVIKISDLKGNFATTKIEEVNKKELKIIHSLIESNSVPKFPEKNLFQAVTDKLYLEKIMEIAPLSKITKIWLFFSDRSTVKNIPLERLEQILVRSCCQGEIVQMPEIVVLNEAQFKQTLSDYKPIVLEGNQDSNINNNPPAKSILVGPEGGWSVKEKQDFESFGLSYLNLGEVVLPAWLAGFSYFGRYFYNVGLK